MGEPVLPAPVPRSGPTDLGAPDQSRPQVSKGELIAGILADALAGFNGQPGTHAAKWERRRELADMRNYEEARWHRDRTAKREDDMRPRAEQVGDAFGTYDPAAQTFEPIYTRPQAFEAYAQARGFKAGTPEYADAVEDYRLGAWSDPAVENRSDIEGVRADGRSALETMRAASRLRETRERLGVTRRGQDMGSADRRYSVDRGSAERRYSTDTASGDRQRGQDMTDSRGRRGQDLTDRRTRESASLRSTGGRSRSGGTSAARIVNPATGQAMVLKGGKWVPES